MSASIELLDSFKSAMGGLSDYATARKLGVAQQTVSKFRLGDAKLPIELAIKMCELADFDVNQWLLRLYAERAKSDSEKNALDCLLNRIAA